MVKFATLDTLEEKRTFNKVVDRVMELAPNIDRLSVEMDLLATHYYCPLDFAKLLTFNSFNFSHDVGGIRENLNRETDRLDNFFIPRCAKPEKDWTEVEHHRLMGK